MTSNHKRIVAVAMSLWMCLGGKVLAEPAYISERLYLGLYAVPDSTTEPIKTLASGTPVEVVQRLGEYVQLQLKDGTEGWARAEFVSKDPPAKTQVQELTAERDRLRQQLETVSNNSREKSLQQQLAKANQKITELNEKLSQQQTNTDSATETQAAQQQVIDELKTQLTESEKAAARLRTEIDEMKKADMATQHASQTDIVMRVLWVLVAMAASLMMGAYIGIRWLSGRVRRRFNGLKVW
ncbi:MAG TPA: TIGR04211 family SH3 domain-containing protein [Gammaproteobacteria bacterium]